MWTEYFSTHTPDAGSIIDAVQQLQKQKKSDHVIALLEAALIEGQGQPWMYMLLAETLRNAGRPKSEIERVLLSGVDFSAVNVTNLLYSAAFLTNHGLEQRALQLYRQAADIEPTRAEAYLLGLNLARKLKDIDGVRWGAAGILSHAWGKDFEAQQQEAEQVAQETEAALRKEGRAAEADALVAALVDARQRDLVVEVRWSGNADLDIIMEEPSGTVCSFESPRTPGGGVLVHDGYGPDQKETYEKYVCPRGMPGWYRLRIRHVVGEVVGKRAVLKIIRYQGAPHQQEETRVLQLGAEDKIVSMTLHEGRLKELAPLPPPEPEPVTGSAVKRPGWMELVGTLVKEEPARRAERAEARGRGQPGRPPVGYQPVITIIPEGVTNTARAVISADRRYVRLTMSPTFSALSDVFTFSFLSAGGGAAGGQGAGGAGGGVGGGGAVGGGAGAAGAIGQQP